MCRIRTIVYCTKIVNQRQKYDDSEQCKIVWFVCILVDSKSISQWLIHCPRFFLFSFFNFYQSFLSHALMIHGITSNKRRRGTICFLNTTSTRSQTFRYLLQVRWLPHVLLRIICQYQAATRWDLPSWGITISRYTNADWKIYQYLHMKIICWRISH